MNPDIAEVCDALAARARDYLDARAWLARLTTPLITAPTVPLVDSDGFPVVMAFMWGQAYVVEFDDGIIRFKYADSDGWHETDEGSFLIRLGSAHASSGDTGGVAAPEGSVGLTVIRGGKSTPVDPVQGFGSTVGDEAERFLRESTRGDGD